ncbi:MAG: hypothetical protein IKT98_03210 [Selenomonadaceae bacterium]|nr:hypothetical protein [Selenomonadaceae bacterium]
MMNNFRFDLQRFDNNFWEIENQIYSKLSDALYALEAITVNATITLKASTSETVSGTIQSGTVIDLGGNTYTITGGNLTIADGVTFTNGTLNITDGNIKGNLNVGTDGAINITGGTFDTDVSNYLAENLTFVQNGNDYIVSVKSNILGDSGNDLTVEHIVARENRVITIGGEAKTIYAGEMNDIEVSVLSGGTSAVISLSGASDEFTIRDSLGEREYRLDTSGNTDGIIITIGSGSAATVGSLEDSGDIFLVNGKKFNRAIIGLFEGDDKFIKDSDLDKITLAGTNLDSSNPNFYKILKVEDVDGNKVLNINGSSDFDPAGCPSGVIAIDTVSGNVYANLYAASDKYKYGIKESPNSEDYLSVISIADSGDVLSVGISFDSKFVGDANVPTIIADNTAIQVNESNGYFVLNKASLPNYKTSTPISLNSASRRISLVKGPFVVTSENQTLTTDIVTVSSYKGGTNGIGVISDTDGNITLDGFDAGESFSINDTTYTMTKAGLIKEEKDGGTKLLKYKGTSNIITGNNLLPYSSISVADTYSDVFNAEEVITLSGSNVFVGVDTIISYANTAFASLGWDSAGYYVLTSNSSIQELNFGKWGGLSLGSGQKLNINKTFTGEGSNPLPIISKGNKFGVTAFNAKETITVGELSSPYASGFSPPSGYDSEKDSYLNFNQITGVQLISGSFLSKKQSITSDFSNTVNAYTSDFALAEINNNNLILTNAVSAANWTVGTGIVPVNNTQVAPVTIDGDGNTHVSVSGNSNYTLTTDTLGSTQTNDDIKYTVPSGSSVEFIYGKDGVSVTNLKEGELFAVKNGTASLKYFGVRDNKLLFSDTGAITAANLPTLSSFKIWTKEENSYVDIDTKCDLNEDYFKAFIGAKDGVLTVKSDYGLEPGQERAIIGEGGNTKVSYGVLSRNSSGYKVTHDDNKDNTKLTKVVITDTLPVEFNDTFYETNIEVISSSDTYSFKSLEENEAFSVELKTVNSSSTVEGIKLNTIHVKDTYEVSLGSGIILIDDSAQTVWTSQDNYFAVDQNSKDGITVGKTVGKNGTVQTISDIDVNESFYINKTKYTRAPYPIGLISVDENNNQVIYNIDDKVTPSGGLSKTSDPIAINVSDLGSTIGLAVAEDLPVEYYDNSYKKVFIVGGEDEDPYAHNVDSKVVNSIVDGEIASLHAYLTIDENNGYHLDTVAGWKKWADLEVVSVASGNTTVNSSLVSGKVIIADKSQAVFIVDDSVNEIFTLSGQDDVPIIGDVKKLHLLDRSIKTTTLSSGSQSIYLGESGKHFLQSGAVNTQIDFDKDSSTATINGAARNKFTIDSSEYTINNEMNFIVDGKTGEVTISDFNEGETFIRKFTKGATTINETYSIKDAGLIRFKSDGNARWNDSNDSDKHFFSGTSIAISSLESGDWTNLAIVSNDTISIPPSKFKNPTTFIDSNYSTTYGTLKKVGTNGNIYELTKKDNDEGKFTDVSIPNSSVDAIYLSEDFLDAKITAAVNNSITTFKALELASGNDTYKIDLSSNAGLVTLDGVATASLLSGSLKADPNISVHVAIGKDKSNFIQADDAITLTGGYSDSNKAAVILDKGEGFTIGEEDSYTLGNLGLARNDNRYLPPGDTLGGYSIGSGNNVSIRLTTITSSNAPWAGIIAPENSILTLSSAIDESLVVVDKTEGPDYEYAFINPSGNGLALSTVEVSVNPSAVKTWDSENTILIDNTTVTISNDFLNKPLAGNLSKAVFLVKENNKQESFAVVDADYGASITPINSSGKPSSNPIKLTQTAGTIVTSNQNQTITAGGYQVAYSGGDGINVVVGKNEENKEEASISALAAGDAFKVGEGQYTLMPSERRLLTADNRMWNQTIIGGIVKVSDLENENNWNKIISIDKGNLTISAASTSLLSGGESAFIIEDSSDATIYGTLTRINGGYTLSTLGATSYTSLNSITIEQTDKPVTLTSALNKIPINAGKTNFQVTNSNDTFAVSYDDYAKVDDAQSIVLNSGTIRTADANQTIGAGNNISVHGISFGSDSAITVIRNSNTVQIGELNHGETFAVGSASYKFTDVGVINADKKIADDAHWDSVGSFTYTDATFDRDLIALTGTELDLSGRKKGAIIANDLDNPTIRVAELNTIKGGLSIKSDIYPIPITSIAMGTNTTGLHTSFDVSIQTDASRNLFTINDDFYKAAGASLTIQSGIINNNNAKSYLKKGTVELKSSDSNKGVRSERNSVQANAGEGINVIVDEDKDVTLSAIDIGDQFTADGTSYSVTSAGLIESLSTGAKIWVPADYKTVVLDDGESSSPNGLNNTSNWADIITIADSVLAVPPTVTSTENQWIILDESKSTRYGTLKQGAGGYSIATVKGDAAWNTVSGGDTISIKSGVSLSLPSSFQYVKIAGEYSKAQFSVTDKTDFVVTDDTNGAVIKNATRISQTGGTIALNDKTSNQVITVPSKKRVALASDNTGDGITVIVDGDKASIGALSHEKIQDRFVVENNTYEMLSNGSIKRLSDNKSWIGGTIDEGGAVDIDELLTNDSQHWGGLISIADGILSISSNILGTLTSAYVVDEKDELQTYGSIIKTDGIFKLDGTTANKNLSAIHIAKDAQSVSLTAVQDKYLEIPITTGDTEFLVTEVVNSGSASSGFIVNYSNTNLSVTDATALTLIKGDWKLTDANQALSANSQTIQVGGTSSTISVSYDGEDVVNVSGIDKAGELVKINNKEYKLNEGDGISVNIKGGVLTVNGISDDDNFSIADDTFIKKAAGFVKTNSKNNSLWIANSDVTAGISVAELSNTANWSTITTADSGNIVIDSNSTTAILVDSITNLSKIYGSLKVNGGRKLSDKNSNVTADTMPNLITVKDVTAGISSAFAKVPISAAGASFAVTALTSGNEFTVDAETNKNAAIIGNVAEVNLTSGTLANLTKATTVKADKHTVAAQDNSIINVGFNDSTVTVDELDNGESFKLNNTAYVYKTIGIIKDGKTLFVNDTLNGSVTNAILDSADFKTMFKSDGTTLTLQSKTSGIFVDSADNSVTTIYAEQNYDPTSKVYTFAQSKIDQYTIDAATLTSGGIINAPFESKVTTSATGTFTINGKNYNAVSELTVDTNATSSSLNKGTVAIAVNGSIDITSFDDAINVSVGSGNGLEVTAKDGTYTLKGLDKNDVFKIGNYTYTMKSDAFISRTDAEGKEELCTYAITEGAIDQSIIENTDYWGSFIRLERDGTLNLTGTVNDGTVFSYDYTAIYAELTVKNGNTFTLNKLKDADTSGISKISLAAANTTLTTDFAATVKTTSGSSTYTVNDNSYVAKDSPLEIAATEKSSTITKGVITLSNSPTVTTTSNHTIEGTISEVDVEKMAFTPVKGDTFTVDNENYKMNELAVGLTRGDSFVWTKAGVASYVLPDNDAWSNMMSLTSEGVLNLKNGVTAGSNVLIDYAGTKRIASLTYDTTNNAYELKSVNENAVSAIQLGDSSDKTLMLTADFDTNVTTGNGTYKINGNTYKGNVLTIKTTKEDNSSKLYSGTAILDSGKDNDSVTDTKNYTVKTTGGDGISVEATEGAIKTLSDLNRGDTFTIDNKYYKVLGNKTLVQTDINYNPSKLYEKSISGNSLDVSNIVDGNFVDFVELDSEGALDLTSTLGENGWESLVIGHDDNGDPTLRIAKVIYTDEGGYKLETISDGDLTTLKAVKLGAAVKTFSTAIDTTVSTKGAGTFTINNKPFTAQNDLTIAVEDSGAILTKGSVTLAKDVEVTTRRINSGTSTDEFIKSTSGTITVTVDDNAGTVTIGGLNPDETFKVGGEDGIEYTMTQAGLLNKDLLNPTVVSTASVLTTDLSGSNWKAIHRIKNGALDLTASSPSNVFVVDDETFVKYGFLEKVDGVYVLTQDDTDSKLSSISIKGIRATFDPQSSDVDITANETTTFSVTATDNFTINAASSGNPVISGASGIYLSAGAIQAPINTSIVAGGKKITATNGDMTVSVADNKVVVGELDVGDTFTVDNANYVMTNAGLLDTTNQQLRAEVIDTYTIDDEFKRIIAVDEGTTTLTLKGETKTALVYDSLTAPTEHLATLTVDKGNKKTLTGESIAESRIQSIAIGAKDNLTVDFETKVNSEIGSVTVNDNPYNGTTALVIDSDGKTSTLYSGTITLDKANPSATDSSKNALARENGSFNATAENGKFTVVNSLDNSESFTYGGKTYTQNTPGLIDKTDNVICTAILAGATIELDKLNTVAWNEFIAPTNKVLDISAINGNRIVYDDPDAPKTKLADLSIENNKKTLKGEQTAASLIGTVKIAAKDNLTVDFTTQVNSAAGSVTVNGNTYEGTTALVLDSDGKTSTVFSGTITLDQNNPSATDSKKNTLARESGTFNATAADGKFTTINGLDPTESFTYGGKTYVQSSQGLRNGALIRQDLKGTTINLSQLDGSWGNILAPTKGVLDISSVNNDAYIYNSETNPTTQLATLTVAGGVKTLTDTTDAAKSITNVKIAAGDNLVVNFVTQVDSSAGNVTVNNNPYSGTTELTINSDGKTSTLKNGTVSLADKNDGVTTTGGNIIVYTADNGGMTVAVDGSSKTEVVTFSDLNFGDTFTIGDKSYKVSEVGPIDNSSGALWNGNAYTEGITLAAINTASNWTSMLVADNATLAINATTLNDGDEYILVDAIDDPTKVYGDLTKADGKYTLTKPSSANTDLTSINASGATIEITADYAGVSLVANDSEFSDVTLNENAKSFTLNTTGDNPLLSDDVISLTLTKGTITAAANQVVTTGGKAITPTVINGTMIIGTTTISGIVEGDEFALGGKEYKMLNTGLFNDTDNKLVTSGITDGTLTFGDILETQLIAVSSAGALDLSQAATGNSLVVDKLESPSNVYGKLNKNEDNYTLDKQGTADGIKFIAMPDADSTLTTDVAAEIDTPSGSKTFTVNGKKYVANDSALAIDTDGSKDKSTLTDGKVSLASRNDGITTTGGSVITYTATGDGMTVAVDGSGETETIKFDALTLGDTFSIGDKSYKVSAVGPIDNSSGALWNGNDYTEGITLAAINTASNWTPMLVADNATLTINATTLNDGDNYILVDNLEEPTKVYGDLTKADGKYTLTKPSSANAELTSIDASGTIIEIAPEYASIVLVANDSKFSDVILDDDESSFTLNATGDNPTLSNVKSLTLTDGTITAAIDQVVTTNGKEITPIVINGTMIIGTETISGITQGDEFNIGDKEYKMLNTGLFNDTDNKLVTSGITDGTFNFADFAETQLIAVSPAGALDLSQAATGNSLVVDTLDSPANVYGKLNKKKNTYTLDKQGKTNGIKFIEMPDADSAITTDVATEIDTPSVSKTFTVNGKRYKSSDSALKINSDGKTSTLTDGTISLTKGKNTTVTTTGGSVITYTATGDGMTVAVDGSGKTEAVTFGGLNLGDTFTIGDKSYNVSAVGPVNSDGALWNGNDYTKGITLAAINKASNWTPMLIADNATLTINATTLNDGAEYVLVDNLENPKKVYGDLAKADGKYILTNPASLNAELTSINASGITIEITPEYVGVALVANDSKFSDITLNEDESSFTLNATGDNPTLSNVKSLTLTDGTITAAVNQTVTTNGKEITPTVINGTMVIGTTEISGIVEGDKFTLSGKKYEMLGTGLFNDTDKKFVTNGIVDGTLTFADILETQLIAINPDGELDLNLAATGDSLVVDTLESPANVYGKLNKKKNTYTLDKKEGAADGIKFITMPEADSTLTTDIVAEINTAEGSNTFTVNGKKYAANDSALVINTDGSKDNSTLTDGKISLTDKDDAVTTTGGNVITYTSENGDGMTIEVESLENNAEDAADDTADDNGGNANENVTEEEDDVADDTSDDTTEENTTDNTAKETIKFDGLTTGDNFTINDKEYKVSAVGPVNSDGALWEGNSYTNGITLAEIDTTGNWTPMLVATKATLKVKADTLADGDKNVLVDALNSPTKVYGDLTKADSKYTLTQSKINNAELTSINASGTTIEIAPEYAGVTFTANDSKFSKVALNEGAKSFTLNTTGDNPILSNDVVSLTLTKGTITAAVEQAVTVNGKAITPTVIKGTMVIGTTAISGITKGDKFTFGDKEYEMLNTGLFNSTDNKLVTGGIADGTLTFADILETQLIAIDKAGNLKLEDAKAGDSLVVDKVDNPANVYGELNKNKNTYKLNKKEGAADGIKFIEMPNATSKLTTDITATVNTPEGSNTFTVNRKDYKANASALIIASDGTTSTLTDGTVSLTDKVDNVTTTSGSSITYTKDGGDGMTVVARTSGSVLLDGLTLGDTFSIDKDSSYRVTELGFINDANYLWTGNADYKRGVTISDTNDDGINNASNWTRTAPAQDGNLPVKDDTLTDGETAVVIDSATAATKTLGTLSRTGDTYSLTKDADEEKISSVSVTNTKLKLEKEFADVPVTADGATFTVTTDEAFTVDATGDTVSISEEAKAIEISKGTIAATSKQTVTATADSGNTKVIAQNNGTFNIGGEQFTVAANKDDITFGMTNGVPDTVSGFEKDTKVTIDGKTYTSPKDNSTLKFNSSDGWYFDGYIPTGNKYNITIDGSGNVTVDSGVKFSDVVASGKTLPKNRTLKLAADINNVDVNVTHTGTNSIAINDKDNNLLVENLGKVSNLTFDAAGVMVEKLADVAGAEFTFDVGKSIETETATITANANDCKVGIGEGGTSLSVDKAATVDAPTNTELTLGNADYKVNGVDFSTSGTAQASITSDGVKLDLVISDVLTYDGTKFDGKGTATAIIDKDGGISLTSGASVEGATGKAFNLDGIILLDANTIDAATATDVLIKASGLSVGYDDVTIKGDEDGYKVNILDGKISGLENIGNSDGVTIGGLSSGTIKTDKVGNFTVADRTFIALGDSAVIYGIENSKLVSADDVASVITGDFTDGLKVNGGKLQVTGNTMSLTANTADNRKLSGFRSKSTLIAAEGITKIEPTEAGKFTFGDHTFETDDPSIAFNLKNSSVTGIDSLENGNLIISHDENNLAVNGKNIDLADINTPVTLAIADGSISGVYGANGGINGLDDATIYGLSTATINGKFFDIAGDDVEAIVADGAVPSLFGLENGAIVSSAPEINARTTENGTFTFHDNKFNINDTLDGEVVFTTDLNSYVTNIGEFEGSISGNLEDINLNDKPFTASSDKITVANDGTDVIALYGLSSGDTISGSLSKAIFLMPEGTLNVNDKGYILLGDDNGVSISGDGQIIHGLDIDASLTVFKGGSYSVNNQSFNAKDGDTFIAGRDSVYIYDPNNKSITEKTKDKDIIIDLIGEPSDKTVSLSGDSAASVIAKGNLDSPMALTLDNNTGKVQNIDFSNSKYSKRVTLLGGDQDVKFNDDGNNAAYVDETATDNKNIELGDGGDVVVNDGKDAKVSVKAGKGNDTIANRHNASTTVDVENNGDTTIVPTSGRVTLQNYDENNNANIRSFEYHDMLEAIKTNDIKFGNGAMTLGDAVVVFDPDASETGGTWANLVDYSGDKLRVGFTHKEGGVLNASTSGDDLIMKGNYAESSSDTQKTGGSTLISGSGNDTAFAGEGDYVNAGAGDNQIYVTDENLRGMEGATIVLGNKCRNTVHNFNNGYETGDAIYISDLSSIKFNYGEDGLVMSSGTAQLTFDGLEPGDELVSYDDSDVASPYEVKVIDGKNTYNAAIAQEGKDIGVHDSLEANVFYGNKNGGSGLNFSEYSGTVEVNLNEGTGNLNGTDAQFYNINKLQAGAGDSKLIGKAGAKNTLIAGTGNASMWSAAGRDLMVGNTSENKNGITTFQYTAGDGRDTITGFDFMSDANDYDADNISLSSGNIVTNVFMRDKDIVMAINESDNDYLRLQDAVGQNFKLNDRIAKVDTQGEFDNLADFYVVAAKNATMKVGADVGDAQVWLDDRLTNTHGVIYHGEIKYLDASTANGNTTLVGNDLDNVIIGGTASNSIWGGFGANNDTIFGGSGHNTFFFGMENGNDVIASINAGDVIDLTTIGLEQIASTTVNAGGTKIELTDGSSLEIKGDAANVEYRLNDGSKYTANHSEGHWEKR